MPASSPLGDSLKVRIRTWLGSRKIWNIELALYAAVFYSITAVSFDALRLNSFEADWLPIWIGTYFEAITIAYAAARLLPASLWKTPRLGAATNLAIAGVVGSLKNSTVFFWAWLAGLETSNFDPLVRILGGAVLAIGIVWSWIAMSASRVGHRNLMIELRNKQASMLMHRDSLGSQVSTAQAELVALTQRSLLPKLEILESKLTSSSDAQALVSELQDLIETDVRPLSLAFKNEAEKLALAPKPERLDSEARRVFPTRFRIRENLPGFTILAFLIPLNALTAQMLFGGGKVVVVTLSALLTVAMLLLWRLVWPKAKPVRRGSGLLALTLGSAIVGLPQAAVILTLIGTNTDQSSLLVSSLIGQTVLLVWFTAYLKILDESRISLEAQMVKVNDQLNHDLSVFSQALWLQKRRWGYLLHGTVQATLTAAIARLNSLKQTKLEGPQRETEAGMLIQLVRQDLRRIVQVVENPPKADVNLDLELSELQQTWQGVLEISIQISNRARLAIDKSENTRMALVEICRESATNAFRHGEAKTLSIQVDRQVENEIELTITNNGKPAASSEAGKGMGQQMLDALTLDWHLESKKTAALTVLSARLPVAAS